MWPWSEIKTLKVQVKTLEQHLEQEKVDHSNTKAQLAKSLENSRKNDGHMRKMAQIIALKGGIMALLFLCFPAHSQPFLRQLFTTNPPPLLSSISGPIVTTNGAGVPVLTYDGSALTNISGSGIAVTRGTNIVLTTNGSVVTINGTTDTNMINTFLIGATNYTIQATNDLASYARTLSLNNTNETTRQSWHQPTNAWTGTSFLLGQRSIFVGSTNVYLLTCTSVGTTDATWGILTLRATGDITVTNHPSIKASDFAVSRVCTNGNTMALIVDMEPGQFTNLSIVQFK